MGFLLLAFDKVKIRIVELELILFLMWFYFLYFMIVFYFLPYCFGIECGVVVEKLRNE